jgi:hypothetical protein
MVALLVSGSVSQINHKGHEVHEGLKFQEFHFVYLRALCG